MAKPNYTDLRLLVRAVQVSEFSGSPVELRVGEGAAARRLQSRGLLVHDPEAVGWWRPTEKGFELAWSFALQLAKAGEVTEAMAKLERFARDCRDNWDCDADGHEYGTGCRACAAKDLLREIGE